MWRLADTCRACATATHNAAPVPDPQAVSLAPTASPDRSDSAPPGHGQDHQGHADADGVVYVYDPAGHDLWGWQGETVCT
jgi:hypothetical protein